MDLLIPVFSRHDDLAILEQVSRETLTKLGPYNDLVISYNEELEESDRRGNVKLRVDKFVSKPDTFINILGQDETSPDLLSDILLRTKAEAPVFMDKSAQCYVRPISHLYAKSVSFNMYSKNKSEIGRFRSLVYLFQVKTINRVIEDISVYYSFPVFVMKLISNLHYNRNKLYPEDTIYIADYIARNASTDVVYEANSKDPEKFGAFGYRKTNPNVQVQYMISESLAKITYDNATGYYRAVFTAKYHVILPSYLSLEYQLIAYNRRLHNDLFNVISEAEMRDLLETKTYVTNPSQDINVPITIPGERIIFSMLVTFDDTNILFNLRDASAGFYFSPEILRYIEYCVANGIAIGEMFFKVRVLIGDEYVMVTVRIDENLNVIIVNPDLINKENIARVIITIPDSFGLINGLNYIDMVSGNSMNGNYNFSIKAILENEYLLNTALSILLKDNVPVHGSSLYINTTTTINQPFSVEIMKSTLTAVRG